MDEPPPLTSLPTPTDLLAQMEVALDTNALNTLCFRLTVDPDNLAGETKQGRLRELVTAMQRRGRYADLVSTLQDLILEAAPHYRGESVPLIVELALARRATLPLDTIPEPTILPPGSRMPFAPNPLFIGREADLQRLATAVRGGQTIAIGQIAAATGLGGIGKTQLASEFVHRYGQYFAGGVFWLNFTEGAGVAAEVAACGGAGALALYTEGDGLTLDEQVRMVRAVWHNPVPRLLVFDNCEEEELLDTWRPTRGGCQVLVTSRRAIWSPTLGVQALPLGVLRRAESAALLGKYRPDLTGAAALGQIAQRLGDLPLALHLVGSYLQAYQHNTRLGDPTRYLEQLERADLLAHLSLQGGVASHSPTAHAQHVGRTFALSYERLDAVNEGDALARALLARAACFAPGEPIPRDLLLATLELAEENDAALVQAEVGLGRLLALGLVEQGEGSALALHPLVALFVQRTQVAQDAQSAVERVILKEARRLGHRMLKASWQGHFRHVVDVALKRRDTQAASLCTAFDYYLKRSGDYAAARPYCELSLEIREELLGPDHHDTATSLNSLGRLLMREGDYTGARPYMERALAIRLEALGPTHPDTTKSLHHLGLLLDRQGETARAQRYLEEALAVRQQTIGASHPDTAENLNSLGALLEGCGNHEAARGYYEQALAIREQVLGTTHPETTQSLNDLGFLLARQGEYERAEHYLERALTGREQSLGVHHPHTARTLHKLGLLRQQQGSLLEARRCYERALAICDGTLGPTHPDTQTIRATLQALEEIAGNA